MKIERKKNAISGTVFGIILKVTQIVFQFVIRTIFITSLGTEYLGLNSLFTAILQVLNLAELGVSSALVFSMYRPIAENDSEKICQLMNLYKRYYRLIGMVVLTAGIVLVPFLPRLIKGSIPADINLYVIYAMNLAATVLSYWLFAYWNSLFVAHQRNDIISIITIVVNLCQYALQVVVLLTLKNYYAFLTITILSQIANNIVTAVFSRKFFPGYNPHGDILDSEKRQINSKVRDLFTSKISGMINNSVDSIVISSLLGLELLAIYQNYYYIISAIMAMFNIFFAACTAGIGNSLLINDEEHNRRLLYNINYVVFIAINFCCACFVSVCQIFMDMWVGEQYVLNFGFVILFAVYLIAEEAPRTLILFKDAGGIWRHDRFRPLLAASANLCLNLLLTPFIGLYGIIISTIFAMLFVAYPWLIININNRLFKINVKKYLLRLYFYFMTICVSCAISYFISNLVTFNSALATTATRFIVSGILSTTIFMIIFSKTAENRYVIEQIRRVREKFNSKGKA